VTGEAGTGDRRDGPAFRPDRGIGPRGRGLLLPAGLLLPIGLLLLPGCRIEPAEKAELDLAEARAQAVSADLTATVRSGLEASAAGWNRGDLDAFMDVYLDSPTTTYVGGSGLRRGFAAIRSRYEPLFEPGAGRDSLRFEDLEVRRLDEDAAAGIARWILHREGRVTESGFFTLVLRRIDGEWKIVHDHSSSVPGERSVPPEGDDG